MKQHHVLASLDPHHIQTGRVNNLCSIYQASLPSPQKCRDRVIKVVLLLHINTFGIDVPHQGLNPKTTITLIFYFLCIFGIQKCGILKSPFHILCVNNVISHDFEECYVRVEKRSFFLRVDFSPFLLWYHLNSPLLPVYII